MSDYDLDDDPGMFPEPEYEDCDETGQPPLTKERKKTLKENALSPKTPLQEKAILSCKGNRRYFDSTAQRKMFQRIEAKAIGADPQSRLWAAWIEDRIKWAAKYHWDIPMLVNSIQSKANYDKWQSKYSDIVLAKPTVAQIANVMSGKMEKLQHADDTTDDM